MANSLSSAKRQRQNVTRRASNRVRKSKLKTQIRKFTDATHDSDRERAVKEFAVTTKLLDQAAAKHTIHRNAAARSKSRLAKQLNQIGK